MTEDTKNKLENIIVAVIMIPLLPYIITIGVSMSLAYDFILDDDDKYQLGKRW